MLSHFVEHKHNLGKRLNESTTPQLMCLEVKECEAIVVFPLSVLKVIVMFLL